MKGRFVLRRRHKVGSPLLIGAAVVILLCILAAVYSGCLLYTSGMLLVDALGNQSAVRAKDKAAHLGVDGNIVHASRNKNLVVCLMHAFTDGHDVVRLLRRTVRNAYAAGQVDECDMHALSLIHI